jgi:hypothetical protein
VCSILGKGICEKGSHGHIHSWPSPCFPESQFGLFSVVLVHIELFHALILCTTVFLLVR